MYSIFHLSEASKHSLQINFSRRLNAGTARRIEIRTSRSVANKLLGLAALLLLIQCPVRADTFEIIAQQAYLKAENPDGNDQFSYSVAVSGDTVVIGAFREDGDTTGVNNSQNNHLNAGSIDFGYDSGAAYVFVRNETGDWIQQAYLKASNTDKGDRFGQSVAICGDTLVIGAPSEDSDSTGIDGAQNNHIDAGTINYNYDSGAAYIFTRDASGTWSQQAYLKASNTDTYDSFGISVAISGDTVVVGADREDSDTTGVNNSQNNHLNTGAIDYFYDAGAAYVFSRDDSENWSQQAYLKASNSDDNDRFGHSVAISGDTIVIGAWFEDSDSTGVNSHQNNHVNTGMINYNYNAGAAYVFSRNDTGTWIQQAYLKASNTDENDFFGQSVAICGDTVAIGAIFEDSNSTGVNSAQNNHVNTGTIDYDYNSGAAYVFLRDDSGNWSQQAYLKASNTDGGDFFGQSVGVSENTLVVGALLEDSEATGINGPQTNHVDTGSIDYAYNAGAAYIFVRDSSGSWRQQTYLKSSNTDGDDQFGRSLAISGDILVVGSYFEDSDAAGINSNQGNHIETGSVDFDYNSGAGYVYTGLGFTSLSLQEQFDVVAAAAGLSESDATFEAVPFSDGVPNLLKFAFNMDLSRADVSVQDVGAEAGGLPSITTDATGGIGVFRFEFVRRIDSRLSYSPKKSTNLSEDTWVDLTDDPVVQPIDAIWERVIYEEPIDLDSMPRCFGTVEVTYPLQ